MENQFPLKLQYNLDDEYRWCELEILNNDGSFQKPIKSIYKLDDLSDTFKARYLYSNETMLWIYINAKKEDVRIKPRW